MITRIMVVRFLLFVFCFFVFFQTSSQTHIALSDSCSKFYEYYEEQDFQNTIKSILECKKNNYITEKENVILDYFLNMSYYFLGDIESFSGKSFEDALNKSDGILNGLLIQLGYHILKDYYSEIQDKSKQTEARINSLSQALFNYLDYGNYNKAIKLSEQVLNEIEMFYGKKEYYANILHHQAYCYSSLGNIEKAISLTKLSLDILKENNLDESFQYVSILGFLATYYLYNGKKEESLIIAEQCLKKMANLKIEEYNQYAISVYHNISICYAQSNNLDKAIHLQTRALTIAKSVLDESQTEYGLILNNLSILYADNGNYYEALRYGEQSSEIFKYSTHALRNSVFAGLALMYLKVGDFEKSFRVKSDYMYHIQNFKIRSNFLWLSEVERNLFWNSIKDYILDIPYYCLKSDNERKFSELAYNSALLSKNILLHSSIELNNVLLENGNEKVIEKLSRLRALDDTLNKLNEKPLSDRHLNTDSLEQVSRELQRELLVESKEFGDYTRFMSLTWEFVRGALKSNEIAVEFVEFPILETDSVVYAALVIRKDWKHPQMIPLFEKRNLDKYLNQTPDRLYAGNAGEQLYWLMWKPLEKYVQEGDNVFFSAAGVYYHLALEYLPSEDGIPLCDKYKMHRLSSTRQLVFDQPNVIYDNAALYGGIQYDVYLSEMLAESNKYIQEENLFAYRGISMDSLRGNKWVELDNTVPEVEFISEELTNNKIKATVFTGSSANEESIKALSGKKTNILHLATHGFFLPVEETRKVDYFQMLGRVNNAAPDMSMRRSGLIMAGGNRAWSGDMIPEGVDDGILTAQEISVLDFRGMDLVVLSACETGLGDINGSEGVFGLQRAFKKAGANTLVMSLWKVNDQVTRLLMGKFYQGLMEGKTKHEAFFKAQNYIRGLYPEPQNWAAFVMLD